MATIAELLVKIGANSSGLRKELASTQRQMKRVFGSEALAASQKAAGLLGALSAAIGGVGVASVIMAGKMSASRVAFDTLLGDTQKATAFLEDLYQFAAETPFEFEGLQDTAKKLLAFKFAAEDIIPIMTAIGDAAGMLGSGQEGIDRMTLAISQMQSKGKVQSEEMLQLAESGVNAWQYLADSMGMSISEVMDKVSKGEVDAQTGINAIILGMQRDFKGGMERQAKEIPGLWATIMDNTKMVMTNAGESLIEALGIKEKLQGLADYLSKFASYVKQAGIGQALRDMIPPGLTAAVFALAGAIGGAAVLAIKNFRIELAKSLIPMAPYIALGATIGALAYLIWKNWEPLSHLFSSLWDTIYYSAKWVFNRLRATLFSILEKIVSGINKLFQALGVKSPVENWLQSINESLQESESGMSTAVMMLESSTDRMGRAVSQFGKNSKKAFDEIGEGAKKLNKTFTGLHSQSNFGGTDEDQEKLDKLKKKAEQVSEQIRQEWVQTTKTQLEQLDIWRQEQLDALNETKNVNKNYLRDVARVNDIYTEKSKKIAENEAKKKQDELDKIKDKVKQVSDSIEREWVQTTKTELDQLDIWKTEQMAALDETKAANENYNRDVERINAVYSQRRMKILEDEQEKLKNLWSENLGQARDTGDIQGYANLLNTERALLEQELSGRQAMIDAYYTIWQERHRTAIDYMAEATNTLYGGLKGFFVDIFNNAKSIGEAWQGLKNKFLSMIGEMVAQWMASRIAMWTMEKLFGSKLIGAASAQGAATAAAWAPAAAMVSLATMGGNAAAAMSGITMTTGLAVGLAKLPALAEGGITTGPTIAEIGEGRYKEAVLPLNKKYFEKAGLIRDHQEQPPIIFSPTIKALDSSDVESWLENGGGAKFEKYFRRRGRSFVTAEV